MDLAELAVGLAGIIRFQPALPYDVAQSLEKLMDFGESIVQLAYRSLGDILGLFRRFLFGTIVRIEEADVPLSLHEFNSRPA